MWAQLEHKARTKGDNQSIAFFGRALQQNYKSRHCDSQPHNQSRSRCDGITKMDTKSTVRILLANEMCQIGRGGVKRGAVDAPHHAHPRTGCPREMKSNVHRFIGSMFVAQQEEKNRILQFRSSCFARRLLLPV